MRRILLLPLVVLLAVLALPLPTAAQNGAIWTVEYYDNRFLVGNPIEQTTNSVSYDWGSGAPVAGIGADNFSVRFSTKPTFPGGTYRFFAQADDEVRVTVDFQAIIDTLDAPRVGQLLTADIFLAPGEHQIQVDYRENTGDAFVFVTWQDASTNPQVPNFRPVTEVTQQSVTPTSWVAQYFGNDSLANFPTAILTENQISQDWGTGSPVASVPADNFSARWSTVANLEQGRYRITTRVDDGIRVFVDGRRVVDAWDGAVGQTQTTDITLSQGQHTFVVEYREASGGAYIEFDIALLQEQQSAPTVPTPSIFATANPVQIQPTIPPLTNTSARGTVDAFRLNVREAPTTGAEILVKILDGETYPIVGRNADDTWWQLNVNGTIGWAFADFIVPVNTASVPVTSQDAGGTVLPTTNLDLTATATVRLRSRASSRGAVLGLLPFGATADIIGRDRDNDWVQVDYNGNVGWVSAGFVRLPVPISQLPLGTE